MTTRRAIGSYSIDASPNEKIIALRKCLIDAAQELAELVPSFSEVEDYLQEAEAAAADVWYG